MSQFVELTTFNILCLSYSEITQQNSVVPHRKNEKYKIAFLLSLSSSKDRLKAVIEMLGVRGPGS